MKDFVHLHVHTEYSLLDGAIKLSELFSFLKENDFWACGITDHGNLFANILFYQKAKEYGIKPIIGLEVYISPSSRFDKKTLNTQEVAYHGILIAKNNQGYKNLIKLATLGYTEGFYYKPRIDKELLKKYHQGLIFLSGCLKGEIPYLILQGRLQEAQRAVLEYKDIFGKDFYLELLDHGLKQEKEVNKTLIEFSNLYDIELVCSNDVHYLRGEDAIAHDVLLCLQTQKKLKDKERLRFPNNEFYFKSKNQMIKLFEDLPSCIKNTVKLAQECQVQIELGGLHLPKFSEEASAILESETYKGAMKRFNQINEDLKRRIDWELSVIKSLGFCDYFLIVKDIVDFARQNDIAVGPGRGSVGGSLVAYCLGTTQINPIEAGLLFERFLNPQRVSLPDIDIDFEDERRHLVMDYITKRYGQEKVANIITFGTMQARAAIRDVARVLDMPYQEADKLAKAIPDPRLTLEEVLQFEEFRKLINTKSKKQLIEIALRLEGQVRHASTHAAGIVIADKPLVEYLPLYQDTKEKLITTQIDKDSIEALGLIKIDILGLKTLTLIKETQRLIETRRNISVNFSTYDDALSYRLLQEGDTTGIFQLESEGMRELLKKARPNNLKELTAILALYRPGPLQSGMVQQYIEKKEKGFGNNILSIHLQDILKETYGVVIYQEQVMEIAKKLAGFSLADADNLRRAMSKKIKQEMQQLKDKFLKGAKEVGLVSEQEAQKVFTTLEKFAEYGFNKSHSAAYAILAYQTAYLKAHFLQEFFCLLLSLEMQNQEKLAEYITEAQRTSIEILPPSINKSFEKFSLEDGKIRFALEAIKNVGHQVALAIIKEREKGEFKSLLDFCSRVDLRTVNKKATESLIKCGAFDEFNATRASMLSALGKVIDISSRQKRQSASSQISLFQAPNILSLQLPNIPEFPQDVIEGFEKELLGIALSVNAKEYKKRLLIFVSDNKDLDLDQIKALVKRKKGLSALVFCVKTQNNKNIFVKAKDRVKIDNELLEKLSMIVGGENLKISESVG